MHLNCTKEQMGKRMTHEWFIPIIRDLVRFISKLQYYLKETLVCS